LLDDDDGPERYGEDPDAPAVLPRKPKASLLKKMAGDVPTTSVGSSLDSFITKANEGLLDVKENPPSRERDLEAKVTELEKKLASAEERAKKAEEAKRAMAVEPVMPIAPQSRGVGGIVVAFVLGCGAMFAVSTFVLKKEPDKTTSVAEPAPSAPTAAPTPAPTPAPAPAPAPTPTPAPAPGPEAAATPDPVAVATPAPPTPATAAAKKHPSKHNVTPTTPSDQPKPPDPAHSGSDELYNPF
jgi:hypothetical protein